MVAIGLEPGEKRRGAAPQLAIERGRDRSGPRSRDFAGGEAPAAGRRRRVSRGLRARRCALPARQRGARAQPQQHRARQMGRQRARHQPAIGARTPAGAITRRKPSSQRTGGCSEPAAQRLRHLRIGSQRRQILRPQGEKTARQIVFLAHRRHYRALPRAWQHPLERRGSLMRRIGQIAVLLHCSTLPRGGTAGI